MARKSKIEWTEGTWNPVTGCIKVTEACRFCYAERTARRLQKMGSENYQNILNSAGNFSGRVNLIRSALDDMRNTRKPTTWFVGSMSDIFNEAVPDAFLDEIFDVMSGCPEHVFQILTKRPRRLLQFVNGYRERRGLGFNDWVEMFGHLWLGVSVESSREMHRINFLRQIPHSLRFVSFEPLLGELYISDLPGIHWIIAGGETGPESRPMHPEWVREVRDYCRLTGTPFFFKQWGTWIPAEKRNPEKKQVVLYPNGNVIRDADSVPAHHFKHFGAVLMQKSGQRSDQHKLDGKNWRQMPKPESLKAVEPEPENKQEEGK